jgi:hypothetical protein
LAAIKNYIYSNGQENKIGDKYTTNYKPIIILERKGNEYYIDYMSRLSHVFRDYNGR